MEWWIKCDCETEALHIEEDDESNELYLSFWRLGSGNSRLRYRLSLIWGILKYGTPSTDMLILNEDSQDELLEIIAEKRMRDKMETSGSPTVGAN